MINYIIKALQTYDSILVSGLGTFSKHYVSAKFEGDMLVPPQNEVTLDHSTANDDEMGFTNFICRERQCLMTQANDIINTWVEELLNALRNNKSVSYDEFGTFSLNEKGKLSFECARIPGLNEEFEGMTAIQVKGEIKEETAETQEESPETETLEVPGFRFQVPGFKEEEPVAEPEPVVEPEPEPVIQYAAEPVVEETSQEEEPVAEPEPEPVIQYATEPVVEETTQEEEPVAEPEPEPVIQYAAEPVVEETTQEEEPVAEPVVEDNEEEEDIEEEDDEDDDDAEIEQPRKKSRWWIWLIIILLIAALTAATYLFRKDIRAFGKKVIDKISHKTEQVTEPDEEAIDEATADYEEEEEIVEEEPVVEKYVPEVVKTTADGKYEYIRFEEGHFYAIAGSFPSESDIENHIRNKGLDSYEPKLVLQDGVGNTRICIGIFDTEEEALEFAKGISDKYWVLK